MVSCLVSIQERVASELEKKSKSAVEKLSEEELQVCIYVCVCVCEGERLVIHVFMSNPVLHEYFWVILLLLVLFHLVDI